ncbi:MAG: phosphomannomutase/phosphoglucomutase [Acidimicrobiia bacterium]|nr:phosphomannomutase/phosphoglucomutase [Acidimicrobiia bacterium]
MDGVECKTGPIQSLGGTNEAAGQRKGEMSGVFKAYDIRGRTDNGELTPELARAVGAAFVELTDARQIAVGWDCRASSPEMSDAMIDGITRRGASVLALGEVPTDVVYYISGSRSLPGVMITASHNPAEYNGIKLCRAGAAPVGEETGLSDIEKMVSNPENGKASERGSVETLDASDGYVKHLLGIVDESAMDDLRVAVDGGNGMAGAVIEEVFDAIPPTLIGLYLEPDGTFPNHPADPLQPENLVDLIALVKSEKANLGVAFDGDADRAFFIDDLGEPLSGSTTTALIARWFLARQPGATIVHNLITSRAVPEIVTASGGKPVRTRVGHSFIKQVMADTGAVFGGEHSGHYYFAANYRADSGMLAMLVLLQVLSESGKKLSEIRTEVEPYAASGEINIRVDDQKAALRRVTEAFAEAEIDELDGLTISWPDRWFNLRASNTEPLLRLNIEGPDQAAVAELSDKVQAVIGGEHAAH